MSAPLRTRAEVEASMRLYAALLAGHRARCGDTVNRREMVAGEPAEDVDKLNALLDTWVTMARVPSDAVG